VAKGNCDRLQKGIPTGGYFFRDLPFPAQDAASLIALLQGVTA
jgi:hypothetical protein